MDGHLGLDLEPAGQHRVGLDELVAESAVAGHNVLDLAAEKVVGAKAHQIVAKVVEGTLILGVVGAGQAVSHHHIGLPVCNGSYHLGGGLSGVGVVAIHQHVGFGIDLAEHAAHDIALTLLILVPDDSASLGGQLGGAVG